jgi:nicotinamidase-related amidase
MKRSIHLLAIDPQNDFCDLPDAWLPPDPLASAAGARLRPQLPVAGAHADMLRLAAMVREGIQGLSEITLTLDSHAYVGIERTPFWASGNGGTVAPFTAITAAQVRRGEYRPRDAASSGRVLAYLDALEALGRDVLVVWPVHCQLGTWGHAVHAAVRAACNAWEETHQRGVRHVIKGTNAYTEHYSPLRAEVPDPADPATALNTALIGQLARADVVMVAGEASSHCVRRGVEDLAAHWPDGHLDRLLLVADCMSPVGGFEAAAQAFLEDMRGRGLQIIDAAQAGAILRDNAA